MNQSVITMYYWGSSCQECDISRGILEDMKQKELKGRSVAIEIKPWFTHIWEALRHGGWHAPVVVVGGKLFSQGVLIDREKLTRYITHE